MEKSELIGQTVTELASASMRRFKQESRLRGPRVVMPGGRIQDATPYLENLDRTTKQSTTFAEIDEHPERYFKPEFLKLGWRYIWIKKGDGESEAKVRQGAYREVKQEELLDDTDLPFVANSNIIAGKTHTSVRSTVEIYDVKLCAVSPEAWDRLYTVREAMGVAKIASNTEQYYEGIEAAGGTGAEIEVTQVNSPSDE